MKNIVFITVDSLRGDYIFGPKAPDSLETLSRLAEGGLTFSNAYSNAGYTKASFQSILSGTYPWMFSSSEQGFEPDRPHIAEILSESGYSTAGFHTNMYLSPTFNYDRGFDYYLGRGLSTDNEDKNPAEMVYNLVAEKAVNTSGVSDVVHSIYKTVGKNFGLQIGSSLYKPADELNDAVINYIQRASRPAFVWVHYMDVHNPFYPHDGTVSESISERKAVKLFHKAVDLDGDTPEEDVEVLERLYRGEIEYFDQQLGDLLERLDETLGLDDTLIAFTSDHGEAFNEKGFMFHHGQLMYDENIHIPIIFNGPGVPQGEIDVPVSNVDMVPTILSNVGIEPPASMVGEDVTTFVENPPADRLVFAEAFSRETGTVMTTDGTFKLVRDLETGDETLYDRREEPSEIYNRLDEYPDVRDRFRTAIDDHLQMVRQHEGDGQEVVVGEDIRLQLRKLGYDE